MARLPNGRATIIFLDQPNFLPTAGGGPIHGIVRADPRQPHQAFLPLGRYPAFIGQSAWFRVIKHKRGVYTFLERVGDSSGAPFIGPV